MTLNNNRKRKLIIFCSLFMMAAVPLIYFQYSNILMLTERPSKEWNWCPFEVTEVKNIESGEVFHEKKDLANYCLIPYNSKSKSTLSADANYQLFLVATNKRGDKAYLETEREKGLLRVDNQVFDSIFYNLRLLANPR